MGIISEVIIYLSYNITYIGLEDMSLKYQVHYSKSPCRLFHRRHGASHRVGAPATVWNDGEYVWSQYGVYHRFDGPCRYYVTKNSNHGYYIRGTQIYELQYYLRIRRYVIKIPSAL